MMGKHESREVSRRGWLKLCGRYAVATLLVALSAMLLRRRYRHGCPDRTLNCPECALAAVCRAPHRRNHHDQKRG